MLVGSHLVGVSGAHRGVACAPVLVLSITKEFTSEKAWLVATVDEDSSTAWSGQLGALHVDDAEIGCSVVRHCEPHFKKAATAQAMEEMARTGTKANMLLMPENMPPPSSTIHSAQIRPNTVINAGISHQLRVNEKVISASSAGQAEQVFPFPVAYAACPPKRYGIPR